MVADTRIDVPADTPYQSAFIAAPYTTLGVSAGMGTQALFGQRFRIYERHGEFAKGALLSVLPALERVDYVGLIRIGDLSGEAQLPTHVITAVNAPVFVKPDIKSSVFRALPRNAVLVGTESGAFLDMDGVGFIHMRHVRSLDTPEPRSLTALAADMTGLPYVWGGTGGVGVDCSGLVQSALAAAGLDAPRDADQQEVGLGTLAGFEERQIGDLLFWPGHVGIVVADDRLLHANAFHMCVAVEPVEEAVARIGPVRSVRRLES